jgi:putative tryptophan/tyrosine transport system substrate-binding protein
MIRRRNLIAMLGGAAAGLPIARMRAADKRVLIGFLSNGNETGNPVYKWFLDGMREAGHAEGKDIDIISRFSGNGHDERLPALAAEIVQMKPDVILATSMGPAIAAEHATRSIPIVVGIMEDPVGLGVAASEARPGGNVTGMLEAPPGLPGKQLELALDILPGATSIGLLSDAGENVTDTVQRREIDDAAEVRGIKVVAGEVHGEPDIEDAFSSLVRRRVQAVIVLRNTMFFRNSRRIADLAVAARIASIWGWPDPVKAGGLVGYGVDLSASFRRTAYFVDRILKGTPPGDLPIEFPKTLVMAVNLKTAAALGLTIPPSVLVRADEVIK